MKKFKKSVRGFTLVELLIVIAILAILAVIANLVINPIEIMKQGRDSDRLTSLSTLQQAINVAAQEATNSSDKILCYPDGGVSCTGYSDVAGPKADGTGWVKVNLSGQTMVKMPTLPIDPSGGRYTYHSDGKDWEITAVLESEKYKGKMTTDGGANNALYQLGSKLDLP